MPRRSRAQGARSVNKEDLEDVSSAGDYNADCYLLGYLPRVASNLDPHKCEHIGCLAWVAT
jgi:hypothetical protein